MTNSTDKNELSVSLLRTLVLQPVALGSALSITISLFLRLTGFERYSDVPLIAVLATGGVYSVLGLSKKLARGEVAADFIAGVAILGAVTLGQYLAATIVLLMLSGGAALEKIALARASYALEALVKRMPSKAHRLVNGTDQEISLSDVCVGDLIVIYPHETCPVDGVITVGHTHMNEAYLTGEPYLIAKAPGTEVISGAVNGEGVITVEVRSKPEDSRYAKIIEVMRKTEEGHTPMRRLGDSLATIYTPIVFVFSVLTWVLTGDAVRALSVLTTATPCPLLIGIPVAVIGAISLCAKRGIIVREPAILEQLTSCRTMIFDKTGTLTYGRPKLVSVIPLGGLTDGEILSRAGALERYSTHPLASAVLEAARERSIQSPSATMVSEEPGLGLTGHVDGEKIQIIGRKHLETMHQSNVAIPAPSATLECFVVVDGAPVGILTFLDEPREESKPFVGHLGRNHQIVRTVIVSGDREGEVRRLGSIVGIEYVFGGKSPEEKVGIVKRETDQAKTIYVGDGINDAPALRAATVGIAMGSHSDVTSHASGATILNPSLLKVDELLHISSRFRTITLQTAIGGMVISGGAMLLAACGIVGPAGGAIIQEAIDVISILNALRASRVPRVLVDV